MVYATSAPLHDVTVISITAGSTLPVLLRVTPVTSPEVIIWVTHRWVIPLPYTLHHSGSSFKHPNTMTFESD